MSELEGVSADDLHVRAFARDPNGGGPRPPDNPLGRLMASAHGTTAIDGTRSDAERKRYIRLKARRAKELRALFA